MSLRSVVLLLLIGIGALALYAWSRNTASPPPSPGQTSDRGATDPSISSGDVVVEPGGDPGIEWTMPERWNSVSGSRMRLATYAIPAASGDADGARCAVYYFGPGQGGDAAANIERWIGEFEKPASPQRSSKTVDGLQVSIVRVRGTYRAHAGMGEDPGARGNHQLYAAVVEGPNGPVFFKLTGPGKTVDAAAGEFERMLDSLCRKVA